MVKLGIYTSPMDPMGMEKWGMKLGWKTSFLRSEAPKKKSYVRHIMAHRLVFNNFFVPQRPNKNNPENLGVCYPPWN